MSVSLRFLWVLSRSLEFKIMGFWRLMSMLERPGLNSVSKRTGTLSAFQGLFASRSPREGAWGLTPLRNLAGKPTIWLFFCLLPCWPALMGNYFGFIWGSVQCHSHLRFGRCPRGLRPCRLPHGLFPSHTHSSDAVFTPRLGCSLVLSAGRPLDSLLGLFRFCMMNVY